MDTVVRLHQCLVDAIRRERPDRIGQPVTVAQVYQELTPYRSVRSAIGVELIADYEHVLLRLLAGEGDLVRLEPQEVRETLRRELESTNPDVTAFRDYAACDVWVTVPPGAPADGEQPAEAATEALTAPGLDDAGHGAEPWDGASADSPPDAAESSVEAAVASAAAEWEPDLPADEAVAASVSGESTPESASGGDSLSAEDAEPGSASDAASKPAGSSGDVEGPMERELPSTAPAQLEQGACTFCGEELPPSRQVRFCPFCGEDQSRQPCPACGEVIEADWLYCVGCGAPAPERAPIA